MVRLLLAAAALAALTCAMETSAAGEPGYRVYARTGKFEDVRDDLKDAIINRGFVIDHVGHLDAMLERTAEAVGAGGAVSPYVKAEYVQFCPAKLTHEAARVTPLAIANCPIAVFAYEARSEPGKINVGYRFPPTSPSAALREVNDRLVALLDDIAKEAAK